MGQEKGMAMEYCLHFVNHGLRPSSVVRSSKAEDSEKSLRPFWVEHLLLPSIILI